MSEETITLTQEELNERLEAKWLEGWQSVYRRQLEDAARALGYKDAASSAAMLISERQLAIVKLRELCERFGDNDWPDELHLGDIIEKHLADHLFAKD